MFALLDSFDLLFWDLGEKPGFSCLSKQTVLLRSSGMRESVLSTKNLVSDLYGIIPQNAEDVYLPAIG
jgi:hypothetical protein